MHSRSFNGKIYRFDTELDNGKFTFSYYRNDGDDTHDNLYKIWKINLKSDPIVSSEGENGVVRPPSDEFLTKIIQYMSKHMTGVKVPS